MTTADYRTRNQVFLAKIQTGAGTEATPTVGSNAIKVRDIRYSPQFESLQTGYVQSSLSESAPIIGRGMAGLQFGAWLKGADTAGTAPDYGPLLRGCGMSETLLASALTGTAQAGAASTITLAASGPSSTNDAYKGMVIRTTGGTGSGQTAVVTAYNGTSKVATVSPAWSTEPDNTTTYSIDACAVYRPVSSGFEFLTMWSYLKPTTSGNDAIRRRLMDGMGRFTVGIQTGALAELGFQFSGVMPAAPDDETDPSAPTYQSRDPAPFIAAQAYLGGAAVKLNSFDFDIGNDVQMFDDPSATYGYGEASPVGRTATGSLQLARTLIATRDAASDWLASTGRELWLRWGPATGKRVSLWLPEIRYTGHEEGDVRGHATERLPFQSVTADGEIWICVH